METAKVKAYAVLAVTHDERPVQDMAQLHLLFDDLSHPLFVVDALGRLHYANVQGKHALERRLGLTLRHAHHGNQTASHVGIQNYHIQSAHSADQYGLSVAIQKASQPSERGQRSVLRLCTAGNQKRSSDASGETLLLVTPLTPGWGKLG